MKVLLYYFGFLLQILGLFTVFYVFLLFFGEASMGLLLKIAMVGCAEFYTGAFLVRFFGKKSD